MSYNGKKLMTVEEGRMLLEAVDKKTTYVTPEMFGAVGDGSTDDATAVQAAITYGKTNHIAVRGFKRYKVSSTLTISGSYVDVMLQYVIYTGTGYAVEASCSYGSIAFGLLDSSNGYGMHCINGFNYNKVNAMRVFTKYHSIVFDTTNNALLLYNTFEIRAIKSDNGNCYHNIYGAGENVFMNSSCACANGWAIYDVNGRFYNFTFEGNVLNGIYKAQGTSFYSGFRIREMVDKIVYQINGNTSYTGGTLIKFASGSTGNAILRFVSEDFVPYEAIDVSEMELPEDMVEEDPIPWNHLANTSFYNVIDAPIRFGNWDTKNGYIVTGKRMLVIAGKKICVPAYETKATITNSDYDMREDANWLNDAKIFPNKMIIGVNNCVIHLPPSYCAYGYSEFIVDQSQGYLCTIYDYRSDSTPIFNGLIFGPGIYKLKAYCTPQSNIVKENLVTHPEWINLNDSDNFSWEIERISNSSGVVCVADFGAVGDGVTDDSTAIQNAVNAGYDIYFESNKTYYLGSAVEITGDRKLHGGLNTTIKTKTPTGLEVNKGFYAHGTLKSTTTLTTDYIIYGDTDNSANRITLDDMSNINIGDIIEIKATDQYYAYSRPYYCVGAFLLVTDIYDGHIYVNTSMPFGITLTANVTVNVYSAPEVHFENLHFISDHDSFDIGTYNALVDINYCKNSSVINCTFTNFVMGIYFRGCVNGLVDNVSLSKSKYDNALVAHDGYGLAISSCTNTVIRRLISLCSQSCIDLTGQVPNINTYVFESNIASEARATGLGSHENSYNLVVEDCVLGGLSAYGTVTVNRCKFIKNNRGPSSNAGINYRGGHRPEINKLFVSNCTFDGNMAINILAPDSQNPVQSFANAIGSITIRDCEGGLFTYIPAINSIIVDNIIESLEIYNWKNCYELYYSPQNKIKSLKIANCSFTKNFFINDHNDSHGIVTANIDRMDISGTNPLQHKVHVNKTTYGEKEILPENVKIEFTQNASTDKFMVCGSNLVSDDAQDYAIGGISGNVGGTLTRSESTGGPTVSVDANGNIIYSQNSNTTKRYLYNRYMFFVNEASSVSVSVTVKNTGNTDPEKWRAYIHTVNPETGLISGRNSGNLVTASTDGTSMSVTMTGVRKSMVLISFYCDTAISDAETTFENFAVSVTPYFNVAPDVTEQFKARRLTGSGSLKSFAGVNNIMTNVDTFYVKYGVDYLLGANT